MALRRMKTKENEEREIVFQDGRLGAHQMRQLKSKSVFLSNLSHENQWDFSECIWRKEKKE